MVTEANVLRIAVYMGCLALAFAINVPLGYLRSRQVKFSLKWFLCIHLSIPAVFLLRTGEGFGFWAIPTFVVAASIGQIVGAKLPYRKAQLTLSE